jgi:hypothetical protein
MRVVVVQRTVSASSSRRPADAGARPPAASPRAFPGKKITSTKTT